MGSFQGRLQELIGSDSVSAFSRKVEIGNTTIQNYLEGALPRIDKAAQIAKATGVSITWLATGEGPRDSHSSMIQIEKGTQPEHAEASMLQIHDLASLEAASMVVVPVYDAKLSAGSGSIAQTEEASGFAAFDANYLRSVGVSPRHARLMQVSGRSMFPTLNDGEWVVVDTSVEEVVDDGLYAVGYGDKALVKKIQMMRDGSVLLVCDNKAEGYQDERVPRTEIHELRIIGRVKQHLRTV